MISVKTIERLCLYRRLLRQLDADGCVTLSSEGLAQLSNGTAAQVRRDLMDMGYRGGTVRGQSVRGLVAALDAFLETPGDDGVVLVGVGNLGLAVLGFCGSFRPSLRITAAIDSDPGKAGRVIQGCRCYGPADMERVIRDRGIRVAVLTVPASQAQGVADGLVSCGVVGILSFAPTLLSTPETVFVEYIDMSLALEKVAYFAYRRT